VTARIRKFRIARIEGDKAFFTFIDDPAAGEGQLQLLKMNGELKVGGIYGLKRPDNLPIRIIDVFFNTDESKAAVAQRLEAASYRHLGVSELTGEAAWAIWNPVDRSVPEKLPVVHDGRTLAVTVQLKGQSEDPELIHVVKGTSEGLTLSGNVRDLQDEILAGKVRFMTHSAEGGDHG
jgi:hypothetical protein